MDQGPWSRGTTTSLIAEFARTTGLSRDTIRFYVKRRLLAPIVGRGGTNRYQDFDGGPIERALLIREAQALGFTPAVELLVAVQHAKAIGGSALTFDCPFHGNAPFYPRPGTRRAPASSAPLMSESLLFSSFELGRLVLPSRIVMSPMTRSRSPGNVPDELVATYYRQRASAGLIVTEGTSPSPDGLGYARIPGLFSAAQVAGWKKVTDAVHSAGGRIFVQLMHTGRVGHPHNLPAGARLVGPSAIAAPGTMWTDQEGAQPHPSPEAMTEADITRAIDEFSASAALAVDAGFDGVELHGANGYLIEQFLDARVNQRTDSWGGDVDNRTRFALAAVDATIAKVGADRVGIRLSPYGVFNGTAPDERTDDVYRALAAGLDQRKVLYVHLIDHTAMGAPTPKPELFEDIRRLYRGAVIRAGGFNAASGEAALAAGKADLIAFGRPFLGNPDLPAKLRSGAPLVAADQATFYTPGPKGYTDYV